VNEETAPFIHPSAIVEPGASLGPGTRVWAFAHILGGARIGRDCNVCDHTFVEGDVVLGDRVTIKSGVQLWDGLRLEDDVFVGPNATFVNDAFPRSKDHERPLTTLLRRGASIGANATILGGVVVGSRAMVGAGAVVTRDVPPNAMVVGNPARIAGYVSAGVKATVEPRPLRRGSLPPLRVSGARAVELKVVPDMRGGLAAGEFGRELPFLPRRYFVIFDVPSREVRGENAHLRLEQFFVCLRGSVAVVLDDGREREEVLLDTPAVGLYIPPMTWVTQYRHSEDAVILVLASDLYDAADYVRDYDEFLKLRLEGGTA
jgi:acetyltransferase-like isoleucine patch superfamily enzyme/dTDP-4-dehydrorhamnose 3,5-epimerase-like enzyme